MSDVVHRVVIFPSSGPCVVYVKPNIKVKSSKTVLSFLHTEDMKPLSGYLYRRPLSKMPESDRLFAVLDSLQVHAAMATSVKSMAVLRVEYQTGVFEDELIKIVRHP